MRRHRKKFLIIGSALALAFMFGASILVTKRNASPSPISVAVKESATYPLYSPARLPSEWHTAKASATFSQNTVLYSIETPNGKIAVTQQAPPPSTFDFNSFYNKGLTGATPFSTPYGTAAIGRANGRYTASLITNKTWILLATDSVAVSEQDMRLLIDTLKPLN